LVPDSFDLRAALQLAALLRRGHYDAVVTLDRSRWMRLAAHFSQASVTANANSMTPEVRHESEVYLDVIRQMGIPTPVNLPCIAPSPAARRHADELLNGISEPFVVLHPGGAQNPGVDMLDKRWPADRFGELARQLLRDGVAVLLSGGPGDASIARLIAELAGIPEIHVLAGKIDVGALAAILSRASVYVGPDTGVSHIAAATGVSTIAIFGPTNPHRYRPLGRDVRVLAPAGSWQIPERDLRRRASVDAATSTAHVSLDSVLAATREAINRVHGTGQCSE
ncbi:MAG: glycosyltransferase family 9 protein, partial [Chloroflexota bacterium]|nr:glycosyltransferase family 9 protein [Chloroflexota bacterium]